MSTRLTNAGVRDLMPDSQRYNIWDADVRGFHVQVHPSGRKSFRYFYRILGRQRTITLGTFGQLTVTQGRSLATKAAGRVADGDDPLFQRNEAKLRTKRLKNHTLGAFIELKYGPWVQANRLSGQGTLELLDRNFSTWYPKPMSEISPRDVQQWQTHQLKRGLRPSTINRALTGLRGTLSKAVEWEIIPANPLNGVKQLKELEDPRVRYLSQEEERRLRKALAERNQRLVNERASFNDWREDRRYPQYPDLSAVRFVDHLEPLVLLAMNTGMRRGELFNLRWASINFDQRQVTVRANTAKGGRVRHIPLNEEALQVLCDWRLENQTDLVFPNAQGAPLGSIKTAWNNLRNEAGLSDFRFHDLRHHFASKLVMADIDLNKVRTLLGHSDLKMTLRYAHLAPEHLAAAVAVLDKR